MDGLLFYDAGAGQGEFYLTDGQGGIARTRMHTGWRSSWTKIIPGSFGGSSFTDLLFYDPGANTGEFYTTDDLGRIALLRQHTDWRSSWTHIIPGNFGGNRFTDLLFYDAGANTGEFYATDGQGRIRLLRQHTDWRSSWTHIIPGNFGGSSFTDLLFYDAAANTGEFYTTDGQGGIRPLRQHTDWRSSWTHIIPGSFGGSSFTDLLFYDAGANTGEFYTTDGQGRIALLRQHTDWRSSWTQIIPGQFGGTGFTDLLFYDAAANTGEFYTTDGQGRIGQLSTTTEWRSSWTRIIPGTFSRQSLCARIHFKSLIPMTNAVNAFIDTQFLNMHDLFATCGITVTRETTEDLSGDPNLTPLQNLNVGACAGQPTQDQNTLFANRNNADEDELVVYVVQTLLGGAGNFLGCATHPDGQPGAVVIQDNAQWLTAHEIGHVLGLNHVCTKATSTNPNPPNKCEAADRDSLMFPDVGWTNVPPDVSTAEESTMRASGLTNPC